MRGILMQEIPDALEMKTRFYPEERIFRTYEYPLAD